MSGHKNIDSLKSYHSASALQQESMYDIISKHQKNREISTTKISISNSFQPAVSSNSMYSLKRKSPNNELFDLMFSGGTIANLILMSAVQNQKHFVSFLRHRQR